jgi:hypothetical protein
MYYVKSAGNVNQADNLVTVTRLNKLIHVRVQLTCKKVLSWFDKTLREHHKVPTAISVLTAFQGHRHRPWARQPTNEAVGTV